jgi:hypothetical protein
LVRCGGRYNALDKPEYNAPITGTTSRDTEPTE